MKKDKIIFWVTTTLIFLFEGVMPALTSQTELAKEGIKHLGYPEYFGNALVGIQSFRNFGTDYSTSPQAIKRMGLCRFCI
jgi:hypothetical protein